MTSKAGNPTSKTLLVSVLVAISVAAIYLSSAVLAQTAPSVVRTPEVASVNSGETVTITLTPAGLTGFFAAKENLDGLELVDHDADNLANGTFIMLQPNTLTYKVKVPDGTPGGTQFEITGQWWTDPSDKHPITPTNITITVIGSTSTTATVTRTPSSTQAEIGDVVVISVTPNEVSGFYAVREDLHGLELVGNTADNLADGTFIMLQANPFQYSVRIPNTAQPNHKFTITGQWWNDPSDKKTVLPATTEITVVGTTTPASMVVRSPVEKMVTPGENVTINVSPQNVSGFYAVKEAIGPLELLNHTADNFVDGTFIMLQAEPFSYEVHVPTSTTPGTELTISGQWWTDPSDKFEVKPPITRLIIEGGTSTVSIDNVVIPELSVGFEIPVRVSGIDPPGLGVFDLTIEYDPSALNLTGVGANPEGFGLTVNAQQGTIRVAGFDISPRSGDFLLMTLMADAVGNVTSSTDLALMVNELTDADGNDIPFTTQDGRATLIPGVVLSVADVAVSESAGNAHVVVRLNRTAPTDVSVRVSTTDGSAGSPADYTSVNQVITIPAGQTQATVAIQIVNDSLDENDETFTVILSNAVGAGIDPVAGSAVVTIRDDDGQVVEVVRTLDRLDVPPGGTLTVTLTPNNLGGFYAVKEEFDGLELVSHTADNYVSGVFVVIQARSFSYVLKVPADAPTRRQYPITGEWWTDPADKHAVVPAQSVVVVIGHCGDQDNDGRVTVIDAIIDLQFLTGLADPTPEQDRRGDVNGDGEFNVFDLVAILRSIVGLNSLPVTCVT